MTVQVYEGDGRVPPEIQTLLDLTQTLRDQLIKSNQRFDNMNKIHEDTVERVKNNLKLEIEMLINQKNSLQRELNDTIEDLEEEKRISGYRRIKLDSIAFELVKSEGVNDTDDFRVTMDEISDMETYDG